MVDQLTIRTPGPELREAVRERYAAAARAAAAASGHGACCGDQDGCPATTLDGGETDIYGAELYTEGERDQLPRPALLASMGCGNPAAVAELHEGQTVLDLGSGGGIDVLLSARRVAPSGTAYGLDMTDEMLDLARRNQREAGVENVKWLKGHMENIPLPEATVDVVISNCVINLSVDKPRVLHEIARVLKPDGRLAVSDVVADDDMDAATRADMDAYTGCIAGALTRSDYDRHLRAAGLESIEIRETHRVHQHAGSAIIRATKPALGAAPGCCERSQHATCCEPTAKAYCCGSDPGSSSCGCTS